MVSNTPRLAAGLAVGVVAALFLTACGSGDGGNAPPPPADTTAPTVTAARATLDAVAAPLWGAMSEMAMQRWLVLAEVATRTGDR